MTRKFFLGIFFLIGLMITIGQVALAEERAPTSQPASAQWPQFHGPQRDNISNETGLLKQWPADGPPLVWKYSECGRGYSGVAIAEGMIFTVGDFGDKEMTFALNLEGRKLWEAENGACWKGSFPGSYTSPTYDHGVLYLLNPHGRLAALQAETGQELWAVDLKSRFDVKHPPGFGFAENLVIDGNAVFCAPGGIKGRIVALDKATGSPLWVNTDIKEFAAYSSPIIVTHHGVRQLITLMQKTLVSVDVATGKLLWTQPYETPPDKKAPSDENVTRPIYQNGYVFAATSGPNGDSELVKINATSDQVEKVWANKNINDCYGGVLLLDGCLWGHSCKGRSKNFVCVDFLTGQLLSTKDMEQGALTYADGLFYILSITGKMSLLQCDRNSCRVLSQFTLPDKSDKSKQLYCCPPVVCGGRLYIRSWNNLFAYNIRGSVSP